MPLKNLRNRKIRDANLSNETNSIQCIICNCSYLCMKKSIYEIKYDTHITITEIHFPDLDEQEKMCACLHALFQVQSIVKREIPQ